MARKTTAAISVSSAMKPQSVLIGGQWVAVKELSEAEDGWVTIKGAQQFVSVRVRESSIDAIKYLDLPNQPRIDRYEVK